MQRTKNRQRMLLEISQDCVEKGRKECLFKSTKTVIDQSSARKGSKCGENIACCLI